MVYTQIYSHLVERWEASLGGPPHAVSPGQDWCLFRDPVAFSVPLSQSGPWFYLDLGLQSGLWLKALVDGRVSEATGV